jgi:uncharacterized protein YceK
VANRHKKDLTMKKLALLLLLGSSTVVAETNKNEQGFEATRALTSDALTEKSSWGGKVVDVIEVPNYTYAQFVHGKDKIWLATAKTEIKKGDMVSFNDGQAMHNFHSKTLNRTFSEIYFVNDVQVKR